MSQVLEDLVDLLTLEPIEENLFRGRSQDLGFRQLFGGQVLGQSLSAASQTVEAERHVHSLHGYFLRPGDAALPVVYSVDRVRDGGSFSTRRVTAIQKGQTIFTCSASFQYDEEGFEHQAQALEGLVGVAAAQAVDAKADAGGHDAHDDQHHHDFDQGETGLTSLHRD